MRRLMMLVLAVSFSLTLGCGGEPKTDIPKGIKEIPKLNTSSGGGEPAKKSNNPTAKAE